jgi:UDP-sugar diphosphatase
MPFKITNFTTLPQQEQKFVHPVQLSYSQDGSKRSWEAVKSHDSVSVLLYHRDKKAFLLVKQFRPAVYMTHNRTCTYELCAGIVDKQVSLEQITLEEIDEECGYAVPLASLEKVSSFFTNVGITGSQQHLFFATIDESMKIHKGGGISGEQIILEFIPLNEVRAFLFDESLAKTPGLMFACFWFFEKYGKPSE